MESLLTSMAIFFAVAILVVYAVSLWPMVSKHPVGIPIQTYFDILYSLILLFSISCFLSLVLTLFSSEAPFTPTWLWVVYLALAFFIRKKAKNMECLIKECRVEKL